jgi:hypothetical protein
MFLVGEMSSIKNEPSDSFWFQGTNQARRGSRKRPDPSSSDATGRDLPRPGLGPDHDQDDPSQGRDVQIGRLKNDFAIQKITVALDGWVRPSKP